jgi:phenylacetate-coenzyme A ligase PaaK-like adenylate-forming protein
MKRIAAAIKGHRLGDTLIRRTPILYGRAMRLFDRLSAAGLEERISWTERRVHVVLDAARATDYGASLRAGATIDEWPLLEKDAVREDVSRFLTVAPWRTSQSATSGTSGLPLKLYRSFSSLAVEQAAIDRLLAKRGVNPRAYRAAILRGDDIKDPADRNPPYWLHGAGGRRLTFSSNHLNRETIAAFANALSEFAPDVLHAYPSILESLCILLAECGIRLSIPLTICSSEVLAASSWSLVESQLETKLIDYYGQAERVSFAYAFAPREFVFLPGYSYNELLPVEEFADETRYELVCTGLWNLAMPLIRFRTGDFVTLPTGADLTATRYGTAPFAGVEGRIGDYLVAPDGARLMGIDHIPRGIENVVRMQVVQDNASHVRLLTIPGQHFSDADRAAILNNAKQKLPPSMRADVVLVDRLEVSASGKTPFVIRRSSMS